MNRGAVFYIVCSLFLVVVASKSQFGFHDLMNIFTSASVATAPPKPSNFSTSLSSTTNQPLVFKNSKSPFMVGSTLNAVSTLKSRYSNWVGPVVRPTDMACYREAHIHKKCPDEFNTKWGTCWAQCPIEFPLQCGMECIRQNDDCKLEVVSKTAYLFQSVMALSLYDIYGEFKLMTVGVQVAFRCAKDMANLVKQLSKYVRGVMVTDPQTPQDQLLAMLYQTDNVVFDIPVTIASCLNIPVKPNVRFADKITNTGELILKEVLADADSIVKSWQSFKEFMKRILLGESIKDLSDTEITSLQSAMKSDSTCGYDMKRMADRTWMTVLALRKQNPQMSENDLRVYMSNSSLVLNDIPIATNNCMHELYAESGEKKAFATRNTLRTTLGAIVEDLIKSGTSSNGTFLSAEHYAYKIADKAFSFYGVWDIKGISNVFAEYLQTICGPTKFMGEIDNGPVVEALGLTTDGKAFNDSTGVWRKEGDGVVTINFKSTDTKDVTVNILSAGKKVDKVAVSAGGTATWHSSIAALGGKTLYLDRWRPGFLGLPGSGGGSLVLWMPRATENGGHLELKVMLNVS